MKVEIEQARLNVCENCAKYGTVLEKPIEIPSPPKAQPSRAIKQAEHVIAQAESAIDENYSLLVKTAREKAKLTQEELAKAIAEKENIIHRIETRQQEPTAKIARKLEQLLHIKLINKEAQQESPKQPPLNDVDFCETELTIGDLLKMHKDFKL
jgi:putative transcription factor